MLASFLAAEFPKTPPWLRLIITSRPDPEVMYPLQAIAADPIDGASSQNEADIRTFLQRELRSHLLDTRNASAVMDGIIERSEGNFLFVDWLRNEVMAGRLSLGDSSVLPKGLGGVYSRFAERQWGDIAAFKKDVASALDVIAAAREPVSLDLLGEINGWSERQQNDIKLTLGSLFSTRDRRIVPFHKSLLDWLTDSAKAGPYFISVTDGNRRLTEHCLRQFEQNPLAPSDYARSHLPAHLIADKRWDALEAVLTSLPFLEGKTESTGVFAVAADLTDAVTALPQGRPGARILQLLEIAIRRELHFLGRHPSTLFQCQWNLCWWFDSPEAEHHYGAATGDQSGGLARPWESAGPKLHVLLERWRQEKAARQPGFIWVRSLRPPSLSLGVGHMVLGGHGDTVQSVSVSADGEKLVSGSRDSTVRLWDTGTGVQKLVCTAGAPANAAISADGRLIAATVAMFNIVTVWDAASGQQLRLLGPHTSPIEWGAALLK